MRLLKKEKVPKQLELKFESKKEKSNSNLKELVSDITAVTGWGAMVAGGLYAIVNGVKGVMAGGGFDIAAGNFADSIYFEKMFGGFGVVVAGYILVMIGAHLHKNLPSVKESEYQSHFNNNLEINKELADDITDKLLEKYN